ncbi:MAG TPA: hypothetical protein VJ653_07300 [Acidimicrobiales bacterium]|nr:hypothetical protein [Acidimicrobiales bacterium]
MTTLLNPEAGERQAEDTTPGCGCCVPPPDASVPEGRRQALAELQSRRDALQRRLEGLR